MDATIRSTIKQQLDLRLCSDLTAVWEASQITGNLAAQLADYLDRMDDDLAWIASQFITQVSLPVGGLTRTHWPPIVRSFLASPDLATGFVAFARHLVPYAAAHRRSYLAFLHTWMLAWVHAEAASLPNRSHQDEHLPANIMLLMRAAHPFKSSRANDEWHGAMSVLAGKGYNRKTDYQQCLPTSLEAVPPNKLPSHSVAILVK